MTPEGGWWLQLLAIHSRIALVMMTQDALTRIGILLDFFAVFLLAPQLIGIARIQRAERWSEQRIADVGARTEDRLFQQAGRWVLDLGILGVLVREIAKYVQGLAVSRDVPIREGGVARAYGRAYLWIFGIAFLALVLGFAVWAGLAWAAHHFLLDQLGLQAWLGFLAAGVVASVGAILIGHIGAAIFLKISETVAMVLFGAGLAAFVWPLLLLVILRGLPSLAIYGMVAPIGLIAHWAMQKLEGDDRLLGILTTWGVVCFMLGSAFQFYATFK